MSFIPKQCIKMIPLNSINQEFIAQKWLDGDLCCQVANNYFENRTHCRERLTHDYQVKRQLVSVAV